MMGHPIQPIVLDESGTPRFKENKIVRFLVDWGRERGMGLNELAAMPFDREDFEQLAQLLGYSVGGFGELSYASDAVYEHAAEEARLLLKQRKAK
jgi:hypothetical protein